MAIMTQLPKSLKKIFQSRRTGVYLSSQAICVSIALLAWIVAFALLLKPPDDIGDEEFIITDNLIQFNIDIVSVDVDTLSLSVLFFPTAYTKCLRQNLTDASVVEIFLDPTLASGSAPSLSSTDPGDPVYRLAVTPFCYFNASLQYLPDLPLFQTNLRLLPWVLNPNVYPTSLKATLDSTLGNYPFDNYHALINMTARDGPTTLSIKTSITPLAPGFSIGSASLSSDGDSNYVRSINVYRSKPVKIYAILVSMSIAIVSVILFGVTVDACLWGYKRRIEVLLLPVATLFAFTQLRQTLPGVPSGTGTILDYYVNLPCFFLLAASSILAILTIAWTGEEGEPRETWLRRYCQPPTSEFHQRDLNERSGTPG
ncbi:hypothetical protein DFH09DRAFT_1128895 [Mycena vulgaris]|nr:hypothetical protein DFH09DRAFT_1128895 [Mycena vulgaris]